MIQLFFLLLTFFSMHAVADQSHCTQHSISIKRIGPPRNQGVSGLCYAYEAADLVSFKLGAPVSALSIALAYFNTQNYLQLSDLYEQGGDTETAIKSAQQRGGFCLESQLPSNEDNVDFSDDPHGGIHDALISFDSVNAPRSRQLQMAHTIFPRVSLDINSLNFQRKKKQKQIMFLEGRACTDRRFLPSLNIKYFSASNHHQRNSLIKKINAQLNADNLVGIGFHSNIIYAMQDPDDDHAATIIGRRWNGHKLSCEYQIRDSFGAQCTIYKPELDCLKGTVWVDERLLKSSLFEIEYIE
jgi:hypothetical protein